MNKKFFQEHLFPIGGIVLLTVLVIAGGYFLGYTRGQLATSSVTTIDNGTTVDADFGVFWQAWKKLRDNQVRSASTTDNNLMYGAISGLAGSFGDPHTVFFPPVEATQFKQDVNGNFGGIGAEIGVDSGVIGVVAPLKDSPAEKAGLLAGDLILKIGDIHTDAMSVSTAVNMIRGEIGTTVVLNVLRKDWVQPRSISIVRGKISAPTLETKLLENNSIMRISLYAFNENAPGLFAKAVREFKSSGAKGIILDLRNNPGGYLEVASELAGWFLPKDTLVVSERFADGHEESYSTQEGDGVLRNVPIVILINQGSASASEILAGALRDQMGAKIVGERSYGKGTVQELFPLKDDSSLKITIAHWVMPKGLVLDHVGIEPDTKVEVSEADIKAKKDVQLDVAVKVLQEQIGLTKTQAVR